MVQLSATDTLFLATESDSDMPNPATENPIGDKVAVGVTCYRMMDYARDLSLSNDGKLVIAWSWSFHEGLRAIAGFRKGEHVDSSTYYAHFCLGTFGEAIRQGVINHIATPNPERDAIEVINVR